MTLVSKYLFKATSDTVSVDPLLLFQQLIAVEYRCAKVWAMCLSSSAIWGYWHHAAIRQPNAIQGWVPPSSTQIPQDVSYIYDGDSLIHKIPRKTWQTYESLCVKYTEYVKKEIWPTNVVLWLPRWSFHKRQFSSEMKEIILFERGNLGTLLKNDFLSVKVNQWRYIFCWVMEWWHLRGLIRSMPKSI